MTLIKAGGPKEVDIGERIRGLGEATLGGGLATMVFWGPVLDDAVKGMHIFVALGGCVITAHGLWRIYKGRQF